MDKASELIEQLLQKKIQFTTEAIYNCKECKDTGFRIISRDDGTESAVRCRCSISDPAEKSLRYYFDSEIAEKYCDASTGEFKPDMYGAYKVEGMKVKKACINFVKKYKEVKEAGKHSLYLYSDTPGSGKTMMACIIGHGLTRMYTLKSQAITTSDYLRMLKNTFNTNKSQEVIVNPVSSVPILVLDEIGAEKPSEYAEEMLTSLIDVRLQKGLTTIFTSNMQIGDLPYHDRMKDRIMAGSIRIAFPEVSIRHLLSTEAQKRVEKLLF